MYGGFADAKEFGGGTDGLAAFNDVFRQFIDALGNVGFHIAAISSETKHCIYSYCVLGADMTNCDTEGQTL